MGYEAVTQQLVIEFRSGRIYRYSGVPRDVYEFLLRVRSKGGYIHRMIDGHFPHEVVSPQPVEQDLLAALQASLEPGRDDAKAE